MNFFEHQDQARKSTRSLLIVFLLAIVAIIALTDLLILFVFFASNSVDNEGIGQLPAHIHLVTAGAVLAVVGVASLYRLVSLNDGGQRVAEEMGARLIVSSTRNRDEKQLLNVVQEMAIASGFPVPLVYVVNDRAMNAFAAGYTAHDAIIAVTTGTLEGLSRDELQGVIAHEFSHIVNGDMRLNMRLIGLVFGILFIGLVGQKIVRFASQSRDGAKFIVVGIGFLIIGYSGLFFGNLIKAMISRQREYLADASAVQFTRNPLGISGALKKIGGSVAGTHFQSQNASEYSHLYFLEGASAPFFGLLNTHPPLEDRISRIEPSWDGRFVQPNVNKKPQPEPIKDDKNIFKNPASSTAGVITAAAMMEAIMATAMPTMDHVNYAKKLISEIPEPLLLASKDPLSAYVLVVGLLMERDLLTNISEQDIVLGNVDKDIRKAFRRLTPSLLALNVKFRLPLIELAIPSLKSLSEHQLEDFNQNVLRVINHDGHVDIWESALHYWLIGLSLGKPSFTKAKYTDFTKLKVETSVLLSALAYVSSTDASVNAEIFAEIEHDLGIEIHLLDEESISSEQLIHAIEFMRNLRPLVKPKLLRALCQVAQKDGVIEAKEVELIRIISEGINCPMPPLLDEQN